MMERRKRRRRQLLDNLKIKERRLGIVRGGARSSSVKSWLWKMLLNFHKTLTAECWCSYIIFQFSFRTSQAIPLLQVFPPKTYICLHFLPFKPFDPLNTLPFIWSNYGYLQSPAVCSIFECRITSFCLVYVDSSATSSPTHWGRGL
jgi:hypothetical protein